MPTRELLTPAQRLRLDELPVDLDDRLMARYHTLSEEELAAALRRRTPTGRLGFAVQIALLKFPGRPLRAAEAAPEKIARYVASQLGEDPRAIDSYVGAAGGRTGAGRETTRREHLSEISKMLGLRHFDGDARAELRAWLLGVAAITDSGVALVEALLEEMRRRAIVVPAMYAVEGLAWEARREARRAVAEALVGGLAREQLAQLDILPEGLDAFRRRLYSFLPRVRLTDLLVEVDSWCGFSEHLTDLRTGRPCKDRELAYAAVLADGTNLGPTKMAEATDDPKVTYERLAWAADWHVREETYQKAIAEVVNAHYRLPFSQHWGEGRTSSSDGQVFFAGGPKDALSQPNAKYGRDRGVVFYTHISDQYAPFYSRVINTTVRDATYVLDGLLYHESDLDLREHHSDTEGFTDQVFGATHLLGYRFAPRIRNIKKTKLFPIRKPSRYPNLAPMIGGKVNVKEISSSWDEVLRLAASIKTGTVTASLILSKLANYPRQNGLAKALREIGKIERSLFGLAWYQDLELRRRVNAGLNKGEARNALARAVFFNRLGELRDRSYEDQQARASGLTLLCSAIGLWNAVYLEKVVAGLRSRGEEIPEEYLRHLSPLEWEHVTLTGVYRWNLEEGPVSEGGFHTLRGVRSPSF